MDRAEALADYRMHIIELARALLAGHDPSADCARERATLQVENVADLRAVSAVIAKHNPWVAAAMRLLASR
jgi:hypothetical protein